MAKKTSKNKEDADFKLYAINLGTKLRQIREDKGWTLEECEERGYPSYRHLGEIERGERNVSLFSLLRISILYKIKIEDLLKGIKL